MGKLKRTLGAASLTFYGVGIIIGAGIYSVIGAAAEQAGTALWLSFLVAAVPAGLAAFSYAEMSAMLPKAGAEYVYLRRALPRQPSVSFITGFVVAFAGAATAATVAIAFAGYLRLFIDVPTFVSAPALLAACTALNIVGIRQSSWVNVVFTSIEVGGLLLIIVFGLRAPGWTDVLRTPLHWGVLPGAALIFFVYTGFQGIANLAEEAKAPERDVPRALLISMGLTTLLYLLVGVAAVALVPADTLAGSEAPLAAAAGAASPRLATALGWIALFSTANTALIALITASRMLFGMGSAGAEGMPAAFARTLPKRQTPWVAALALLGVAVLLLPLGEIAVVASVSSFTSLLAFSAVSLAVIVLRYREPDRNRPFRIRPSIGRLPVLPALHLLSIAAFLALFERTVYLAGAAALATGGAVYMVRRFLGRRSGRTNAGGAGPPRPHA